MSHQSLQNVDFFSSPTESSKLLKFINIPREINTDKPNSVIISGDVLTKIVSKVDINPDIVLTPDIYVTVHSASEVLSHVKRTIGECEIYIVLPILNDKGKGVIMTVLFKNSMEEVNVIITRGDPVDVVTDLNITCRQCWTDGFKVYGTHLEETSKKNCMVKSEHVKKLLIGSSYTSRDIEKYSNYGFNIFFEDKYHDADGIDMSSFPGMLKPFINTNWEEVIVKKILYNMDDVSFRKVFKLALIGYTLSNFMDIFNINNDLIDGLEHSEDDNNLSYYTGYINGDEYKIHTSMIKHVLNRYIRNTHELNEEELYMDQYDVKEEVDPIEAIMRFTTRVSIV